MTILHPRPKMTLAAPFVLPNGVTRDAFFARFPDPFEVENMDPWEIHSLGLAPDRSWFRFTKRFTYISDRFGLVTNPAGSITDFASVPSRLQSVIANDAPCLLLASAPHDQICTQKDDGTRGWTGDGNIRITFASCNDLISEAMYYLGASSEQRAMVHSAVTWGNLGAKKDFPPHDILTP